MKRKSDDTDLGRTNGHSKKQATDSLRARFGGDLFDPKTVQRYKSAYAASEPYKHAVVSNLISDELLRNVRAEITENIHFTPKETDIYKIHQSGDLANLDGLPASALQRLPSLLKLRDALYSKDFREWISTVSGAGPVSGKKTDMAVNVYVPGCHLLCHDDVIGSRRVSYILYLTDPVTPWQAEWGGALRLYSTDKQRGEDGKAYKLPRAEWSKVIPPAWNQLSFFAVQPGESFHDVEEVYRRAQGESEADGGRVRMAISGWFHIPQLGEEGFELGLEEKLAEKSSLQQLQGKADLLDRPRPDWRHPVMRARGIQNTEVDDELPAEDLSEEELEFLLKYMTPNYLTPDTVDELRELFEEESTLQLSNFLNKRFADHLRAHLSQNDTPTTRVFETSRPPHKHRYQYLQPAGPSPVNPYEKILEDLLPSLAFRRWLSLATGLTLRRCSVLARRFRRGLDYQLAQGYEGETPQLEYTLCVTPSRGWGAEEHEGGGKGNGENGHGDATPGADGEDNVGGYELYMAGDDDDNQPGDDNDSEHGVEIPSHTGAGDRRSSKRKKADPAVYQAAAEDEDEDDGILFSNPASWNTLSVVLRDRGTLRFVKYVSQAARGDRWDFTGEVEAVDDEEEEEEEEEEDEEDSDGDVAAVAEE